MSDLSDVAVKSEGGPLRAVTLMVSIVLAVIPLAGIAWIVVAGTVTTVDGLFMSLILLSLSGIFLLNAFWELRDRGWLSFLGKNKPAAADRTSSSKPD